MNIIGPISISEHYNGKYDKHIYIFGDEHINKKKCEKKLENVDIIDFFKKIISENPKETLDFFFEISYSKKNVYEINKPNITSVSPWLQQIQNKFYDCLKLDKSNCKYKNVRMHYLDIRKLYFERLLNLIILFYPIYKNNIDKNWIKIKNNIELLKNYYYFDINKFSKITNETKIFEFKNIKQNYDLTDWKKLEKIFKLSNEKIIEILKIEKQFENIIDDDVKEKYKKIKIKIFDSLDYLRENFDFFRNLNKNTTFQDFYNFSKQYKKLLIKLNTFTDLFDAYMIGRIFRQYKNNIEPKKIIVFMGEAHAKNLRFFLSEIGFTEKIETSREFDKNFQCVDISKFYQPFFNKNQAKKEILERFCQNMTASNFSALSQKTKDILLTISKFCLKNKIGDEQKAKKIGNFYFLS